MKCSVCSSLPKNVWMRAGRPFCLACYYLPVVAVGGDSKPAPAPKAPAALRVVSTPQPVALPAKPRPAIPQAPFYVHASLFGDPMFVPCPDKMRADIVLDFLKLAANRNAVRMARITSNAPKPHATPCLAVLPAALNWLRKVITGEFKLDMQRDKEIIFKAAWAPQLQVIEELCNLPLSKAA